MVSSPFTPQSPPRPLADLELISRAVAVSHGLTLLRRGPASAAMVFLVEGEAEVVISERGSEGGPRAEELVCGRLYPGQSAGALGLLGLRSRRIASVRTRGPAVVRVLDEGGWTWLRSQRSGLEASLRAQALRELRLHIDVVCGLLSRRNDPVAPTPEDSTPSARRLAERLSQLEGRVLGSDADLIFYDQLRMLELSARGAAGAI